MFRIARSVLEDDETVKMVGHDHEFIELDMEIVRRKFFPAAFQNLAQSVCDQSSANFISEKPAARSGTAGQEVDPWSSIIVTREPGILSSPSHGDRVAGGSGVVVT